MTRQQRRYAATIQKYECAHKTGTDISTKFEHLTRLSKLLKLKPGHKFVDVGSGHGIPSLILGALNPEVEFIGYELIKAKIAGSKRLAKKLMVPNTKFITADFTSKSFQFVKADFYYLFNPSSFEATLIALDKIIAANLGRKITILSYLYKDTLSPLVELGFPKPVKLKNIPIYKIELDLTE